MLDETSLLCPVCSKIPVVMRDSIITFRYQLPDLRETAIIFNRMQPLLVWQAKVCYITGLHIK